MKVSTLVVVSWASILGLSKKPAKLPGVDTSHVGRSGTLGSQPSLEKGEGPPEEMDQVFISNQEDQALGGNPPKKKDGMERSLNY